MSMAYFQCASHGGAVSMAERCILLREGKSALWLCRACYNALPSTDNVVYRETSMAETDAEAIKRAYAPRVTLASIEANIAERWDGVADDMTQGMRHHHPDNHGRRRPRGPGNPLSGLSVCFLVLRNGFTVIGHSAAASPENFDPVMGKKIAYENALRQIWPLMGYELKERLMKERA